MARSVTFLGYTLPIGANGKIEEPTDPDLSGGWNVTFLDAEEIRSCPLAWCSFLMATTIAGQGRAGQVCHRPAPERSKTGEATR